MSTIRPEVVLLASGGLDSTTLAYWLYEKNIIFQPLFINYGQHCAKTELETLTSVLPADYTDRIAVVDVSDVYKGSSSRLIDEANLWEDEVTYKDLYLPYRSLMLLSLGAAFAQSRGCQSLYSAFINSNHAQEIDCSTEFFEKLAGVLSGYGGVELIMPFRFMPKYEVAKIGIRLKAPIGRTFSCQASSTIPCGACPNCVDRLEALRLLSETPLSELIP
jgi:7-cyano-7-deazaguanine synthase